MGTHPIFESDFDCLTECFVEAFQEPKSRDGHLKQHWNAPQQPCICWKMHHQQKQQLPLKKLSNIILKCKLSEEWNCRLINSTSKKLSVVSVIFTMVKKHVVLAWKTQSCQLMTSSPLIVPTAGPICAVSLLQAYWQNFSVVNLVVLMARVALCTCTLIISMEATESSVPRFHSELVSPGTNNTPIMVVSLSPSMVMVPLLKVNFMKHTTSPNCGTYQQSLFAKTINTVWVLQLTDTLLRQNSTSAPDISQVCLLMVWMLLLFVKQPSSPKNMS